jgi:hypothetical protein
MKGAFEDGRESAQKNRRLNHSICAMKAALRLAQSRTYQAVE